MSLMARVDQARNRLQAANERLSEARGLLDNLSYEVPDYGGASNRAKYQRFDTTLAYMHEEMITNINNVDGIRFGNAAGDVLNAPASIVLESLVPSWLPGLKEDVGEKASNAPINLPKQAALVAWGLKVRQGGEWDHKPKLRELLDFNNELPTFPIPGDDEHEYNYDIWSNIHYGYVGRSAGFEPYELLLGAQIADKGVVVPSDDLSARIGIELWEEYGTNLTPEQLHQAILDHKEEYLRIQDETNIVVRPIDNGR